MNKKEKKVAIVIGAGPAGLTAAYELLKKTNIRPIIIESLNQVGGLSRTVNYKGNRIDIGGHRFFSKSKKINKWWNNFLKEGDPENLDNVILRRSRLSRIYFLRKFFDYPISLSLRTLLNLGFIRTLKIGFSYIKIRLFPIRDEKNLQDFFINRFGKELYNTFFKDYTKKVWGVSCDKIDSSWGAQRIKGVSITKAVLHALKSLFKLSNNNVETSLISEFLYPKFGPGQMWEVVAEQIKKLGGQIYLEHDVVFIDSKNGKLNQVKVLDKKNNKIINIEFDYIFSSMPVKDLVNSLNTNISVELKKISDGLIYRDFITVGVLLKKLKFNISDNWIYIQEKDVNVGRIQIFNNWSPYMVKNSNNIWIGLEYFCQEGDELWNKSNKDFIDMAIEELLKLGFIDKDFVLDSTVIKVKKAYPAYFGTYKKFDLLKNVLNKFENLYLIGRNGMHRYNNMDHSMLSAIQAVENIVQNNKSKDNIWSVNAEKEYHEEKR
jgi:protoporphyrinogen oxidase